MILNINIIWKVCRSQWPRSRNCVWSWTTRKQGSWVRVPLEACLDVRFSLCCSVLCRQRPWYWPMPHLRNPTKMPTRIYIFRRSFWIGTGHMAWSMKREIRIW